ncbi:hypothetical protein BDN67DRAFT_442628 [Paxillus ammoniavirescens]|nr:hypothetical protein BDN67DRAFT_442628 [Paxillus ammoniavirescens]
MVARIARIPVCFGYGFVCCTGWSCSTKGLTIGTYYSPHSLSQDLAQSLEHPFYTCGALLSPWSWHHSQRQGCQVVRQLDLMRPIAILIALQRCACPVVVHYWLHP